RAAAHRERRLPHRAGGRLGRAGGRSAPAAPPAVGAALRPARRARRAPGRPGAAPPPRPGAAAGDRPLPGRPAAAAARAPRGGRPAGAGGAPRLRLGGARPPARARAASRRGPGGMNRRVSRAVLYAALLAGALGPACRRVSPDVDRRGMNVLIVLVDTLRADHLGCYRYARPPAPRISPLAAESAAFR